MVRSAAPRQVGDVEQVVAHLRAASRANVLSLSLRAYRDLEKRDELVRLLNSLLSERADVPRVGQSLPLWLFVEGELVPPVALRWLIATLTEPGFGGLPLFDDWCAVLRTSLEAGASTVPISQKWDPTLLELARNSVHLFLSCGKYWKPEVEWNDGTLPSFAGSGLKRGRRISPAVLNRCQMLVDRISRFLTPEGVSVPAPDQNAFTGGGPEVYFDYLESNVRKLNEYILNHREPPESGLTEDELQRADQNPIQMGELRATPEKLIKELGHSGPRTLRAKSYIHGIVLAHDARFSVRKTLGWTKFSKDSDDALSALQELHDLQAIEVTYGRKAQLRLLLLPHPDWAPRTKKDPELVRAEARKRMSKKRASERTDEENRRLQARHRSRALDEREQEILEICEGYSSEEVREYIRKGKRNKS